MEFYKLCISLPLSIFQQIYTSLYYLNKPLTDGGQVTHICVGELAIIGSDNVLPTVRHQAIIWTNAGILLILLLDTNFNELLSKIHAFFIQENAFKHIVCEMVLILYRPQYVKQCT